MTHFNEAHNLIKNKIDNEKETILNARLALRYGAGSVGSGQEL